MDILECSIRKYNDKFLLLETVIEENTCKDKTINCKQQIFIKPENIDSIKFHRTRYSYKNKNSEYTGDDVFAVEFSTINPDFRLGFKDEQTARNFLNELLALLG